MIRKGQKILFLFLTAYLGLSRSEDSLKSVRDSGHQQLPFRQLGPLNSDDRGGGGPGRHRGPSGHTHESREVLNSVLQSSPPLGSAPHTGPHVVEPELLTTSQEIEVVLGDTTVLPCKVAHLGDGTVLWKQGERVISAGSIQVRKDYRLTLVEANSLRITNVDVTDTGNYTCEVEWIGSPISITHKLTVLVPPSIVAVLPGGLGQVDHPIEAREGSQVRLECRAEGIPPPIVRWRSPNWLDVGQTWVATGTGGKSDGSSYGSKRIARGPIMQIDNVRRGDAGTYMCTASNNVGTMSADEIDLRILYPPEVSSAQRAVFSGPGDRDVLTCIVKAEPRANVTWYKDGRRVFLDQNHVSEEHDTLVMLRLKEITIIDLGNYTCEAENSQGVARDHIELSGKPSMATINSSPEGLYRNSYNLTWSIKSSSPLEKVRILFRKMDQFTNKNTNGTWSNILVGLPHYWNSDPYHTQQQKNPSDHRLTRGYSVHSHLFRNLEADTRYEVIVQSQNQFGWSEPTKPFIFSTRYQDYSPLNMASHPSFRGGLISSSNQITLSSTTTAISLFILLLMHHRI